jgi:hypothetical protein
MRVLMAIASSGMALVFAGAAPASAQSYGSQVAVNQCAAAAQARLSGGSLIYRGSGRVLGVTGVQPAGYGLIVHGVADSGRYPAYAYVTRAPVDLSWQCSVDYRGIITSVSFGPVQPNYAYEYSAPQWNYDVSRYGYVRY